MLTNIAAGLPDGELATMTSRAWREAVRSRAEARRAKPGTEIRLLLTGCAESDEAYWQTLRDEIVRREQEA
jgi:hypothetical protein